MSGRGKPHVEQNDASARWVVPHWKQVGSKASVCPTRRVTGCVGSSSGWVGAIEELEGVVGVSHSLVVAFLAGGG